MASPTVSNPPEMPHERGVFIEDDTFPGLITYRVYACNGRLMEAAFVSAEEWNDPEIATELKASLDRRCPPGTCDGLHGRAKQGTRKPLHLL